MFISLQIKYSPKASTLEFYSSCFPTMTLNQAPSAPLLKSLHSLLLKLVTNSEMNSRHLQRWRQAARHSGYQHSAPGTQDISIVHQAFRIPAPELAVCTTLQHSKIERWIQMHVKSCTWGGKKEFHTKNSEDRK